MITALIKKNVEYRPRNWHNLLSQVLWAYRNSSKDLTRTTLFKLVYGHDAVLPIEINLQNVRIARQDELPVEDYWNMLFDELNELQEE